MKKSGVASLIALSLLALAGCGGGGGKTGDKSSGGSAELPNKSASACKILTIDVAKKFFGGESEAAQEAPAQNPTGAVEVTNCNYSSKVSFDNLDKMQQVGLLVRAAQNSTGASDNENAFKLQHGKKAQDVPGYGDQAFWDPGLGQFNILKHNNWYILTAGAVMPASRTLDEAKRLADLIKDKL